MPDSTERIKLLFQRYLSGMASVHETRELMNLIDKDQHHELVKDLISEQLNLYDAGETDEISYLGKSRADELFEKLMVGEQEVAEPEIPQIGRRTPWFKWAAAAAVILLISTLGYQYLQKPETKTSTIASATEPYPYDVPPGKMNAVLTLSDGRRINLESASNGNIALEGNTLIIKENGAIKYDYTGGLTEVQYNTVSTQRGNQFMVVLPDQTKVWLNASSSITFPAAFTGKSRWVKITGEAYFEVAKKEDMPFKVSFAGDGEIEVLGTHFNVNTYRDDDVIRTTLIEGSVKISRNKEAGILKPGQQAQMKENATMKITDVDTDEIMAWKNGFFNFRDADIKDIMHQLSRWYDIEIKYEGEPERQLFTGEIDRSLKLVSVLKILEKTNVRFRLEEKRKLVILP